MILGRNYSKGEREAKAKGKCTYNVCTDGERGVSKM